MDHSENSLHRFLTVAMMYGIFTDVADHRKGGKMDTIISFVSILNQCHHGDSNIPTT